MRRRVCNFCPDELRQFHGPGMHLINDLRGIDSPFAPPKSLRTNAFLRHLSESKIPFPHDIFDQAVPPTSKDHRKLNKSQRQIVNQARISLLAEIESLQDDTNINSTVIRARHQCILNRCGIEATMESIKNSRKESEIC